MTNNRIRIGARIHDFVREGENLVDRIKETGVEVVQFTLQKFIARKEPLQNYSLSKLRTFKSAFDSAGVEIKVLSCYINPLSEDVEKEKMVFKQFVDYCSELKIEIIGTETGSVVSDLKNYKVNLTEENYEKSKDCLKSLIDYANFKGITVGIEVVSYYPICSAARFTRLLNDINGADICSIFDATNLLNIDNYMYQEEIIEEFISIHSEKIKVIHLKDFIIKEGFLKEVPLFSGNLNVKHIIKKLKDYGVRADIIVEGAHSKEEYQGIERKLRTLIKEV